MSHRRVKAVGFDDDDYEDDEYEGYEEEEGGEGGSEEVSAEDQEQLLLGTVQVKSLLGDEYPVTDKEIHDALWHYFYDIDKTVAYLKNLKKPPQTQKKPKAKQVSRFDQAAKAAEAKVNSAQDKVICPYSAAFSLVPRLPTANTFFWDTPWGHVPPHRLANIEAIPRYPRGGLLGGSGKPSKLAALAAARKKREEEKQASAQASQSDRSIALLDRLGGSKSAGGPPESGASLSTEPSRTARAPFFQKKPPSPVQESVTSPLTENPTLPPTPQAAPDLRARPSVFAQTMFGQRTSITGGVSLQLDGMELDPPTPDQPVNAFQLPYVNNPSDLQAFSGPSPDDVVLRAQSKGGKSNSGTPSKSKGGADVIGATKDVAALSVKDSSSKHKNLNVLEEFKKADMKAAASFVVVGHVDHGKSTLMGRLLYDLKVVDEASMERLRRDSKKIGKSSFALAWVMDATADERERGITVDIATNHFETEKTRFTILDAPGHQDFIPNMIAGASQADFAVLVIDASTNSFESGLRGQTREHAMLVRSMGVQRLIVAVNKMDMCNWAEERFTEIQQQMSSFLEIANFKRDSISFIPCSGLKGENIIRSTKDIPEASWYTGPTLVQELDNAEPTKRALDKPLRMTISEVFRASPNNPISVSGKLDAGSLQAGDVVVVAPSGEKATIKSLEADGQPADWAVAGQIAVLNLADIDPVYLRNGDILCHPATAIKSLRFFTAKILAIDHVMPMFVEVHRGPLHVPGKIATLVATLDKQSGSVARKKPKVIQPGSVARVLVELESEMPLETPNKVILRSEGKTVAAGLME